MAYGYKIRKEAKDWTLTSETCREWTPRGGRRKARAKVRQKEQQHMLLSLTLATGFLAYPYGISEAAIVPKDGSDSNKISVNGNVYNISPQGTNGSFAYNRFKEFNLDQGYIANLLFGNASTLANLVNNKININGIVNAVRNNHIDGHLMFLSPKGIVVGAAGVINAGQFTGIVPMQTDFDKLYNATDSAVITLDAVTKLQQGSYALGGTIDISGQINTHSGVMLGAGIINIKDGSKIQSTKSLNFTNLVNIKGGTSAGLNSLTAVEGTGGDIILTAKQESAVKDTKPVLKADGTPEKDESGKDKTEANAIRWRDRSTDLSAAVNVGKNVNIASSDSFVKLTAESSSTYEDSTPMTLTDTLKNVILGSEETIVDGLINKLAGKEAAANKYLFANYSNKKNKSSIKIGENSIISGKNIDAAATSMVEIKQSLAVPAGDGKKDSNGNTKTNSSVMPVAAVTISRINNNADVVIDGSLTATGADENGSGIRIAANADTTAELSATASGGEKTSAAVGVAVLSGDTNAKVTVNAPASAAALTAAQGKVSVESVTNSDIDVSVNAVGTKSYVVSNVGVANYDTSADVVMERSITAGAVDIKAENNITGLSMTVDNTVPENTGGSQGKDTSESTDQQKTQDNNDAEGEKNSEKKSLDPTKLLKNVTSENVNNTQGTKSQDSQTGVQKVVDKAAGTNESGTNGGSNNEPKTSAFGLGASVGVVANKNDANVTIGKNAVINAAKVEDSETLDGSVNVAASTLMTASKEAEDSLQFSVNNTMANAKVEIGAAVLVSNVKNNAKILLDNEGEKSAQIKGDGETSLNAAAGMGTYKVDQKKKDENGKELNETEEVDKSSILTYEVSAENASEEETPSTFALGGSVGINNLKNKAIVLLGQKSKVEGSALKLSSDVTTNAEGKYGAEDENNKVGIGATVGLQNISNNSLVMAGKGVELTGTESVEAKAGSAMNLKNNVKNAGKGDSFGVSGMVALSYGDSNNIVSLDDETVIQAPEVSFEAGNSTNVDNSARSESEGSESSKAFGIGVGIINYDVNSIAMVGDNGSGITAPLGNTTDVEKAAQKIYRDGELARNIAGSTFAGKLGAKTSGNGKGSIITGDLSVSASTTGMIKNDAKAKAVSSDKEDEPEESNERTDSQRWTQWSNQGAEGADEARNNTENLEQDNVTSQNESAAPNASGAGQEAGSAANPDETPAAPADNAAPAAGSGGSAGASIGIEGSVALTFLGGRTDAVLDNVTVKNGEDGVNSVSLSATDLLGSITLGGTNVKHSLKESDSATKVGIGGTFAMNSSSRDVDSLVRKSDIQNVTHVANEAAKLGIEVAAGMGTSASTGSGTNIAGAGVVYYNRAKQDIHALLIDNTMTSNSFFTLLSNEATSTDFQIAGGLAYNSASGDSKNVGVGGAVAISQLENNLASGISGGKYTDFTTVRVEAEKGTTQINGALAATKAGGSNGYGFEGAFAYGSVKNNVHAYISGAETQDTLGLGEVCVKAGEISVVKTDTELAAEKQQIANVKNLTAKKKEQLQKAKELEQKKGAENKKTLADTGIDPTGKIYLDTNSSQSSLDDNSKNTDEGKIVNEAAGDEDSAKSLLDGNYSRTITAAMAGGWSGKAGAGAGIAYNYVKNDIAADIKDSTLATYAVKGEANGESLIFSLGAGAAIGGKAFNGAGSGSWNDLKNDVKVTIADNIIKGSTLLNVAGIDAIAGGQISAKAENTSSIINIAGEVAGGKGMALGLSLAYNSLNNTTGSYLTGNTISMPDIVGAGDSSVNVTATNKSKALAVAGGVDVNIDQSFAGAVGTVAINRGTNNTESLIDGKTTGENTHLDNLKKLVVAAEELTKKTTVAGGISVGGKKVGIGGAVAYTAIGSSGSDDKKEKLRAEINHADITTTETGVISVAAKDSKTQGTTTEKSRITTVGAGLGVGWGKNWFNLQGAAAVSDIYKDSRASLNNTNINKDNANAHPSINVAADTKSKINTVGAVGNISITGKVTGTVGLAINRMDQDTKAEMATDNGKTTKVNAGLTQVRATGDGDIHSVGVGGTVSVGEYVTAAGSGSYNYIGNDVDAIIKNQNLSASSSVGVVAQSDDRLYNFAGGFNIGANTRAALGTSVSTNRITGNANALVSGGSLTAADTGSIEVTRPQDANLFNTDKLDLTTDRQRLSENRKKANKSGIVVDSSATHTIISQQASGGVAAATTVGLNLAGTVNINTIEGRTTAKIQDADLNSAGKYSNVNVNAVDYTNFGSFTGTPAVGVGAALGVSLGVSANWETYDRTTEVEIASTNAKAKKNVYAKDLTVDATAKHGSSALSFAAAAGGGKVGIASGDSIMRHKNTSTVSAKLDQVNAVFDGKAEIKAEHLGNSHTQNIAASVAAGMAAVTAGAGVSVIDDTSTVKAEVNSSGLKAKNNGDGKDIAVLAKNENNWKNTLVTASLAAGIGAGLAANVGIYNTSGETAAVVNKSALEAANVKVNATDKLTATATGGVGAGGVGGAGVAVTLNNINSSVSAHVAGGSIKAAKDIDIKAEEVRSFDSSVTGVAVGGLGVGVNVAVTSINKGITDAQLSNAADENGRMEVNETTQNEIRSHLNTVNKAKGALGDSDAKFYGMNAKDKQVLDTARNVTVDLSTPKTEAPKDDAVYTKLQGIHTEVSKNASLLAGNNVNVTAKETSDIFARNVGVTVGGGASVNVTDAIIHTNYDTDVSISGASIEGRNVAVNALQTQAGSGSEVKVTAVTVGALGGVGVGYAGIVNKGAADVNITGSTIKAAENVSVKALDESKHKSQILSVGVAALNVTTTFASVENKSNVGVTLAGTNNISADGNIAIDAKKANALEAHTQGVGVGGVNVAVNHATIEDGEKDEKGKITKGIAAAKITGTNGSFSAKSFHLGAANDTTARLSAGNTAVSVLGVSRMRGKGVMNMGAEVDVAGGTFNAGTVDFASQLGNANGRTLEGNVKGHNISAVAVAPDAVILNTDVTSKVNVRNSTFAANTDLILDNESYVDRKAYIYSVTAGAVAVGNTSADISGKETLESTLTGKAGLTKLNNLQVFTYGENTGKAFADAGGGGLVGYVGAHVDNKSTNKVTSTLGGKWETAGEVYLIAAQADETRLTASEGHGGIAGVGGTSVDNTIDTTTKANVENNTEITSDRVHIGTSNVVNTGAYDDTDDKGNKDVQSYTLKDHFGGVISGNRLRSLLDITENGTVTIGENAKITTNKLQEYIAASQNDLTNHVQAKGGGVVAVTDAVSEMDLDIHNKVDVKKGAVLSNEKAASTEDILLAAYDNQTIKSQVDGTVYAGVISPIVTKNNIDMNRTSDVTVAGNIESGSKVGLYAGAKQDGTLSNLNADLKSGAYNYSVISITTPRVNYDITADKGTVDVSGIVRANGDINVIASGGKEEVIKDQSLWNWALGGSSTDKKFLTSDAVVADEALPKYSYVNVTGSLIAGTADPINLTIKGSVANGLTLVAPDNKANNRVKNGVKEGTFDYANTMALRWAELDKMIKSYNGADADLLAAYIAERSRIQDDMIRLGLAEKDAQGKYVYTSTGRPVYFVEIPDIATGGGNINVTANDFTGTGNLRANAAPGVTITNESDAYLKLNNILMGEQGGKIVYNANIIPPNTASGNAKINNINVKTNGAKFREIYGVTNGEAAGLLVENKASGPQTTTIPLTAAKKQQMRAEVNADTTLSAEEKSQWLKAIDEQSSVTYTSLPDVEINGKLSNFYGNVTISNNGGDIRISGGTTDHPTGVKGNTVKLIAPKGSIAQSYKEGIVNINGDPEKYLADNANTLKNSVPMSNKVVIENIPGGILKHTYHNEWTGTKTNSYTRSDSSQSATGYIAGRDVYVSASNINVNGLIQSGYKNYTATVTQAQLDYAMSRPAGKAAVVQNRTMYKVNDGGAKWNSTDKVFDYVPQVYWDPSTKKLVVEDIDTAGGKVYLTGKIASTGDGRIVAADGAANISVTNETALDMNVGKVLNNQREGVITIVDMSADSWLEFKKGQTREIRGYTEYMRKHGAEDDPYQHATVRSNALSVNQSITFSPAANQTYTWTKGEIEGRSVTKQHHVRYGMWGLVKTKDMSEIRGDTRNITQISSQDGGKYGLPDGATIQQNSANIPLANEIRLDAHWKLLSNESSEPIRWLEKTGFLGWFKNYYTRWTETSSTLRTYNYSVNASQPITIGLIGAEKGSINLSSTNAAGGSINLTGNVANSHNEAVLTVNAKAGGIFQNDGTTLKSEIVNLQAKDDIKNIHIASVGKASRDNRGRITSVTDNIRLTAISTGKGDIDITAVGGMLENWSLPGNVQIQNLKSQDGSNAFKRDAALGDVSLNAAGDITQVSSGTKVEGRGINLVSQNGSIGKAQQNITIAASDLVYAADTSGAQVNAAAKGSIYLTEAAAGGDMRIGKIESQEGDVSLTVKDGSFLDALSGNAATKSSDSVDDMVHRWIDAGLIDGEKDARGNYTYKGAYIEGLEKNRDDYKANVETAYTSKTQAEWQKEYADQQTAVKEIYASAEYHTYLNNKAKYDKLTQDERRTLADNQDSAFLAYAKSAEKYAQYSSYATAEAYLKDTAAYKYSQYTNANAYLAADATYKELVAKAAHPTFEWTKDMMLYAISEKIVNRDSGSSTQTERPANVLGRNVDLIATKGAVGTYDNKTKVITVDELTGNNAIARMKELMNVDASDVKVHKDAKGNVQSFEINTLIPIGVKASGQLNVQAGSNVYVAGRTDKAGEHSALNLGTINVTQNKAKGDVRLFSDKGIYNALDNGRTNITGKDLILTGGKESIGTQAKPLTVSLSGDLTEARADKNVYIKNMGKDYLRLGAMFAGDTISLNSEKGFLMSNANADIATSYINAGKNLNLLSNTNSGIVGTASNPLRILNDRATVNIQAKDAYIRGMGSLALGIRNGTLYLGDIRTMGEFVARSDGSLAVGRRNVAGSVYTGGNVKLEAEDDLTLNGTVAAGELKKTKKDLTLKAAKGSITQGAAMGIRAAAVSTTSKGKVDLQGTGNQFEKLTVNSTNAGTPLQGSVLVKDTASKLDVSAAPVVAGNIEVENRNQQGILHVMGAKLQADGMGTAKGDISLKTGGTLQTDAAMVAANDVKLTALNGDVSINNDITTGPETGAVDEENRSYKKPYNSLNILAGGFIREKAGVAIDAPVVYTYSGKGVSLESKNNKFACILVSGLEGSNAIDGSVKAVTNHAVAAEDENDFTVGIEADILGDAEFTNLHAEGDLDLILLHRAANGVINVTGGNGAKGSLMLTTGKDITLFGDVKANYDLVMNSKTGEGGFYGLGRGMTAGHDVNVSVGNGAYYIGEIHAGNDLRIQVNNPTSMKDESGIFIGDLPDDFDSEQDVDLDSLKLKSTRLEAGHEASFIVNGDGKIDLEGFVNAGSGNVIANISGKGDIDVTRSIQSREAGISLKTGVGSIQVGMDNVRENETVKAKKDVNLATGLGTIYILGGTITQDGDIRMEAGKNSYTAGDTTGNFIIRDDGVIDSGGGVGLYGRNGDIHITDDIKAKKGIIASITEQGNVYFDRAVSVTKDVSISADKGNIEVGHAVSSGEGSISLKTKEGNILIGNNGPNVKTVAARKDIALVANNGIIKVQGKTESQEGDIVVSALDKQENNSIVINQAGELISGRDLTLNAYNGDIKVMDNTSAQRNMTVDIVNHGSISFGVDVNVAGDITMKTGSGNITVGKDLHAGKDINLQTGQGDIGIVKTVIADGGSVNVTDTKGNILIGSNGRDVKTLAAKQNINLHAADGIIKVQGKTESQEGDIVASALSRQAADNIVIENDGKLISGRDLTLQAYQGNIEVSDDATAKRNMTVDIVNHGNITFGVDVNVAGDITMKTGAGNITVGKDLHAGKDINLQTGQGDIGIVKTVIADGGSVNVTDTKGNILIGSNGRDVKTLAAQKDIHLHAADGIIKVQGKTESQEGDIFVSALSKQAIDNIVIENDGKLISGRDLTMQAYQGNIEVTDDVSAKRNMTVDIVNHGSISFGIDVNVAGDITMKTGSGNITVGRDLHAGNDINLQTGQGDIGIVKTVIADGGSVNVTDTKGNILIGSNGPEVKTVAAKQNINLLAMDGVIKVQGKTESQEGDIVVSALGEQDNNIVISHDGKLISGRDLTLQAYNGDIEVTGNTSAKRNMTVDIVNHGSISFGVDVTVAGDLAMKTGNGDIHVGKDLTAGEKTLLQTGAGNIVVGWNGNGNVSANNDITIQTGGNGNIQIVKTVISNNGSVDIENRKGNIRIGSNGADVKTVAAKQNVKLQANEGQILIQGKTFTEKGDIIARAGNATYAAEAGTNNIVFQNDGKLEAGKDAYLIARNGDLMVTDDVTAKGTFYARTEGQGNITLGKDLTVQKNLSMSTEKGDITIGKNVTAAQGNVAMQTGTGDVIVGYNGNGNVKASEDITIQTGKGNVRVVKTVISDNGSVNIINQKGNILIGSNGPDVRTVAARKDVNLLAYDGVIDIQGKTESEEGDILTSALSKQDDKNIVISQDGKLLSGRDLTMNAYNGDMEITGNTTAKRNMTVDIASQGNISFGADVSVNGNLAMSTNKGDIHVGKDLTAGEKTLLQTGAGNVVVGYNGNGNVRANDDITIQTGGNGNIQIVKTVISNNGSVDIENRKGNIQIGSNGANVKTVAAKQDVKLQAGDGQILIKGKTFTENGDIMVQAGTSTYAAADGASNIVFKDDGKLEAGKDAYLIARNGDLVVTDDVTANGTFYAQTKEQGSITLGENLTVKNDLSMRTEKGDITIGRNVTAAQGNVIMQTGTGNVTVGAEVRTGKNVQAVANGNITVDDNVKANENVTFKATTGNIKVGSDVTAGKAATLQTGAGDVIVGYNGNGNVKANEDITIQTGRGNIAIVKTVISENGSVNIVDKAGNIQIGNNGANVKTVAAKQAVNLQADNGQIRIQGKTFTENGDITVTAGNAAGNNIVFDQEGKLEAGKDAYLTARNGDLVVTDDVMAKGTFYAQTKGQGNITLGEDLTVQKNLSMSTEKGDITIGRNVIAAQGNMTMQAGTGNVTIGADVKAGKEARMETGTGDIMIGRDGKGSITAVENVNVMAINGDIGIERNVESLKGNVAMSAKGGSMIVGADVKAGRNISAEAGGNVIVDAGVTAGESVTMNTDEGDILIGADVKAGKDVTMTTNIGNILVGGDGVGSVMAGNDVLLAVNKEGSIGIGRAVTSSQGNVTVQTEAGGIYIGNDPEADMVMARKDMTLRSGDGIILIDGGASTEKGDILVKAGNLVYTEGMKDTIAFGQDGRLKSGKDAYLIAQNGDLVVTRNVTAENTFYVQTKGQGNITFGESLTVKNDLSLSTETGSITIGNDVTSQQGNVSMQVGTGDIQIGANGYGSVTAKKDVDIAINKGNLSIATSLKAEDGSLSAKIGSGKIHIGDNGPDVETVTAGNNITLETGNGKIEVFGKTSTINGDITLKAASSEYTPGISNIIIAQNGLLDSGRDLYMTGYNGDLHVTDASRAKRNLYAQVTGKGSLFYDTLNVNGNLTARTEAGPIVIAGEVTGNYVELAAADGNISVGGDLSSNTDANVSTNNGDISLKNVTAANNVTIFSLGNGSINANNIVAGEITHVSLTNGDLFLNLAEGRAVWLQMENNTEASKVNQIRANASGGTDPDVALTGNFIQIGSIEAKEGDAVFELSAMGAGKQKLISGNFYVGSLRSQNGSHMKNLWSNRGYLHVDEGSLALDDVLAVDKIHLDNKNTTLAIYGRTPTRDGEQLVYWNNLSRAYSKERAFQLYTDGRVRTHGAILIDAGRNYGKLYGDNLSVVDMMRERVSNTHGQFTFDSTLLTEPGRAMREQVFFDMESTKAAIQQQSAGDGEIVVEEKDV